MSRQTPLSRSTVWKAIRRLMVGADGISGAAIVELAVCLPVLVVIVFYTIDFGLLIFNKMEVQNAAQAGAQYVVAFNSNYTSSGVSSAVTSATRFTSITPSSTQFCGCPSTSGVANLCSTSTTCTCSTTACADPGVYVTVTAAPTALYTPLIPFGGVSSSYNLTAQSTVRLR